MRGNKIMRTVSPVYGMSMVERKPPSEFDYAGGGICALRRSQLGDLTPIPSPEALEAHAWRRVVKCVDWPYFPLPLSGVIGTPGVAH